MFNQLLSQDLMNWTSIKGNSTQMEYYAGVETGNPSGSTTNIKFMRYFRGTTKVVENELAYNAENMLISIKAN